MSYKPINNPNKNSNPMTVSYTSRSQRQQPVRRPGQQPGRRPVRQPGQQQGDSKKGNSFFISPGAAAMMNSERSAAELAIQTGVYAVYRCTIPPPNDPYTSDFCARIGPNSRCFCDCPYSSHQQNSRSTKCKNCSCKRFKYIPSRPEEIGDDFLPRRRGFNIHTWRAKCRCGHPHGSHDPNTLRGSGCNHFESHFLCAMCDRHWEDHETVFESEEERRALNRPVRLVE